LDADGDKQKGITACTGKVQKAHTNRNEVKLDSPYVAKANDMPMKTRCSAVPAMHLPSSGSISHVNSGSTDGARTISEGYPCHYRNQLRGARDEAAYLLRLS
jgi:hypothetical protein